MVKEQELLERARACLAVGEGTGSRGKHPSNVYNVLSDLIDDLARRSSSDEQAEVVGEAEPFLAGRGWENLSCDDQFSLATQIAANIGYELVAEPEHPDSPHNRAHDLASPVAMGGVTEALRDLPRFNVLLNRHGHYSGLKLNGNGTLVKFSDLTAALPPGKGDGQ